MKHIITYILFSFTFSAHGANIDWNGSLSQDWHNSGNWTPNQVPSALDDVTIVSSILPVLITTADAHVNSLTMNLGQLLVGAGRGLTIIGINPGYSTTVYMTKSAIVNNGTIDVTGAMYTDDSVISNDGGIFLNGNFDNTPISLDLDNYSSLLNTSSSAFVNFRDNIEPSTGNHKQLFIRVNNTSSIFNGGTISNTYNTFTEDWSEKGIEINNNSTIVNQVGSTVFLESVQINGIHIKNDVGTSPISIFDNSGTIDISKCTVCNYGEFTCGIKVEENAQFIDNPTSSTLIITDFTDVNDSDMCIAGVIGSFGSISGPATNMSNYTFDPTAILQGIGVIIIDNGSNSDFSATVSPGGAQVGKIIFEGNFSSTSSTIFKMKIEGNGEAGMMMGHDQIDWGTDETTLSLATLQVDLTEGFLPNVGDQFQLFLGSGISGDFEKLDLPGDNNSWNIDYNFINEAGELGILLSLVAPISNLNNAGIGTINPRTKLEINGGDILLSSIGTGVVLTSPGGQFYKVTVDDNGVLQTELIPCPEVWECP